jgi:DNA-binding NarL/FixJ family response regulator
MKKHIMLVENDRNGYLAFMEVLDAIQIDCKVTYTTDYDHALQMLEFLVPDCVFIKIDINEKMVLSCVRNIREHPSLKNAKIILYADNITTGIIKDGLKEGADYCINSPQTMAHFSQLFKDLFGNIDNSSREYAA